VFNSGNVLGFGTLKTGGFTNNGVFSVGGGTMNVFGSVNNVVPFSVAAGDLAVFFGDVSGQGNTGPGTVKFLAGVSPGASPAEIAFGGDVVFGPAATLEIELGGLLPGDQFDRLAIVGDATLDGSIDVLLIDGFTPSAGNSFEILHAAGGIFNDFDDVSLPALPGGLGWNVVYSNFSLILEVSSAALPGDFNLDGVVDGADYVVWRKGLGTTYTQDDYDVWQANFGQTAGSGSAFGPPSQNPVPEPAPLILLGFAMPCLALAVRGRSERTNSAPYRSP
jgi:hypothetical protein